MPLFRKKPVVIEAIQLDFNNKDEIKKFLGADLGRTVSAPGHVDAVYIQTLEGTMRADPGDWIIRGVKGELYPCKDDIFKATYDPMPQLQGVE